MIPANAAPLAIALLGLVLGMRHATDPDHVIAVTTILSRERRLSVATRIGVVWGLGHTITVLTVGAAIIVFKIAIPTRLGLAMEFAVARRADPARCRRDGGLDSRSRDSRCARVRRAMKAWSSIRTRTLTTAQRIRIRTFTLLVTKTATTRRITIIASPRT